MIEVHSLTKTYGTGAAATPVLRDVGFTVAAGEIFAVVGPSGAGKSTLAQCLNLLERPTSGTVVIGGQDLTALPESQLRSARRRIGTVFQASSLLRRRTAAENVALPLEYLGVTKGETRARVAELLDRVGLADKACHYPHQLSGGQRQRVGIARALALRPKVLLSDEATSGLDPEATAQYLELLRDVRDELDLAVVLITHEMDTIVRVADSAARLDHGVLAEQGALVDLLTAPASVLGEALRAAGPAATAPSGQATVRLTYDTAVPADWLSRVTLETGAAVALLSASVQAVGGVTVGTVTIGVDDGALTRVLDAARALGLRTDTAAREAVAA
ncbi:ATP-binding cassette domain-containing protein [Tsukamurella tyrosinosolvens]|uniref:methionine ABC transporter ATP-binding protein n=2 Tax=Tsukamurella tyrosinosolvens TaxID=57704 RepID=UPI000795C0FB|nr:ATP-binding cassette domain-containing protein [Tsukamurella tyrosinosolvens]KXP02454.1 methionine ABC transporter ATP-binding protein [Tsukamurella tyrosinosolvens]KZL96592.1 methionine ABC transporter ATP-binding protein [Tsukamurella tyrosinosolvens]MCA4996488.1 ATP-binding cassette domain-containing protein [Tsukamurella tyrosinosolvens]